MYSRHIAVVLFISVLSACDLVTQIAHPTETVQPTFTPMLTKLPITTTPELENTLSLTPSTDANLETPLPDWKGIPVIPGASKGEIKPFGYMYWVDVTAEEVEAFYTEQMKLTGWPLVKHINVLSWYGRGELLQFKQENSNEIVDVIFVGDTEDNSRMVAIKKYIYHP